MKELSQKAIEVVETDKVKFLAEQWKNLYLSWMRNVRDWCISRQIWWGHPIPISTCKNCGEKFLNSDGEQEWNLCPKCGSEKVEREKDVLDTWFSSALWPFAVLGWPEQTKKLKAFYPTDILVTGFDIIFFWVARMIVMGLFFMGDVPFRKVYVHGLIRDEKGQKMSKTRGNVLDPLDLVEKYGSDSLRFSLCVLSSQIKDIKLSEKTIESYYHFMNKVWNAAKFVIMNVENPKKNFQPKTLPQMWILAKLSSCIEKVKEHLEDYKINQAAMEIYEFFWNDFCDWYIEISKVEMQDEKTAQSAKNTLFFVLETSLRLLHPFCPAITSHIWDEMKRKYDIESESEFLSYAPFPDFEYKEETCLEFGEKLISVAKEIRSIKDEVGFKVSDKVQAKVLTGDEKELKRVLEENIKWLEKLSGANIDIVEGEEIPEGFIPSSGKGVVVAISSEGAKLKESIQKIRKELAEAEKEFDRVKKRLSNSDFLEKADPEVIQEHKKRLEELGPKIEFLRKRIEILSKFAQN